MLFSTLGIVVENLGNGAGINDIILRENGVQFNIFSSGNINPGAQVNHLRSWVPVNSGWVEISAQSVGGDNNIIEYIYIAVPPTTTTTTAVT